ncbi:MAG: C1 family peptidase [Chitinophagaceae bacterium]
MRRLVFLPFLLLIIFCEAQKLTLGESGLVPPVVTNCTSVKDQYMSSTCWSFSSVSLLESELMKTGKGKADLSEMFIARYSLIRKIRWHLKLKGGNFFTPGGQFHDAVWVISNFGMVPEEAYNGKGRGEFYHNHAELDTLLSRAVKEWVNRGVTELDTEQNDWVDSLLNYYLGKVPGEFVYKGRTYTPHSFADQYLEFHPGDYVEITSYTHHPFYSSFVLENKYNWTGDKYYNVTIEDFTAIADNALDKGFTVGWDGDATGDGFNFGEGLVYMPAAITDFQSTRQKAFEDRSTELDHMMHIVGSTKDRQGKKWYYVKNSWGVSNPLGGFLFMREDYFRIRTVAIIVNKNAIPVTIRGRLGL